VTELVVELDRVPPPLTLQVTPALFLSLLTVAVNVTESLPSTDVAAALTETPTGLEPPPQPERLRAATTVMIAIQACKRTLAPERTRVLQTTDTSQIVRKMIRRDHAL
jgi:hypothetical protein